MTREVYLTLSPFPRKQSRTKPYGNTSLDHKPTLPNDAGCRAPLLALLLFNTQADEVVRGDPR